jgi:hypothetical protein
MGGTCSTSDAKCTSLAGQAGCASCASSCFSAPAVVENLEDQLEAIVADAIQRHLVVALTRMHVPQPLAIIAEEAALEIADQISPRVHSAPPRFVTSPMSGMRQLGYRSPTPEQQTSPIQSPLQVARSLSPAARSASPVHSPKYAANV